MLKECLHFLVRLTTQITSPLLDDGQPDIESYNDELEKRSNPQWHDVSWLYAECYLYRCVLAALEGAREFPMADVLVAVSRQSSRHLSTGSSTTFLPSRKCLHSERRVLQYLSLLPDTMS
jgi:hypothetical protein